MRERRKSRSANFNIASVNMSDDVIEKFWSFLRPSSRVNGPTVEKISVTSFVTIAKKKKLRGEDGNVEDGNVEDGKNILLLLFVLLWHTG